MILNQYLYRNLMNAITLLRLIAEPKYWALPALYIIETMHSYTLPMSYLSGLHLSLLTGLVKVK